MSKLMRRYQILWNVKQNVVIDAAIMKTFSITTDNVITTIDRPLRESRKMFSCDLATNFLRQVAVSSQEVVFALLCLY